MIVDEDGCRVESAAGTPESEIRTDAATWRDIDDGRVSGIEAFARHALYVKGSTHKALEFEPMFDRPAAGALRYEMHNVDLGGMRMSALVTGPRSAPPLILLHGLGATKSSWLTVVPELAARHRVIAVDLPGFGASSKPRAPYDAPFFADATTSLLDALGYGSAFVAGNSMGGRVAMEMALRAPERVSGIACLCPAAAFYRRPGLWLVRLARPELGLIGARLPRKRLIGLLKQLFADPDRVDERWYDSAIDEFLQIWRSPRFRMALYAAARNIYLDEPAGDDGFWARLASLETPALYVYGEHDAIITPRFGRRIRGAVPHAQVEVWDDCGHVPQIEWPERTVRTMLDFFAGVGATSEAV